MLVTRKEWLEIEETRQQSFLSCPLEWYDPTINHKFYALVIWKDFKRDNVEFDWRNSISSQLTLNYNELITNFLEMFIHVGNI